LLEPIPICVPRGRGVVGRVGEPSTPAQRLLAMTHKLLLADDSVTIQRVIELTFADEGIEVVSVGNGQQAIDRIASERPDIVLADASMPERDGYEVAAFV
jgi:CheY-like chemotaxis protein